MPNRSLTWPIVTIIVGGFLLLTALPNAWKPFLPSFLQPTLHLGLDLQGGTQLDFRISEADMEKQIEQLQIEIEALERTQGPPDEINDKKTQIRNIQFLRRNIVEAIRNVLERRVNALGVSEAIITPSYYGNEKHLLVECPGIIAIQECIAAIGKTILLEFKEQFEGEDEEHIDKMRALAKKAHLRITASGETLETIGQDLGTTLGAFYGDDTFFQDEIPDGLEDIWERKEGDPVLYTETTVEPILRDGELIPHRGIFLAEVIGEKEEVNHTIEDPAEAMAELAAADENLHLVTHEEELFDELDTGYRTALAEFLPRTLLEGTKANGERSVLYVISRTDPREEIGASHILIAYEGAARAGDDVLRTREQAQGLAEDLKQQLVAGTGFSRLAREYSDGPSGEEGGGLGTFARGAMTPIFEEAAFALTKQGALSDVIETEFGFHIIRLDEEPQETAGSLNYIELLLSGDNIEQTQTEMLDALKNRTVSRQEEQLPLRTLFFSFLPTGWKDTPLDGKHFRRATVTTDSLTGLPVVQIVFDREGGELFYDLTKRNVGKPIAIFVGGELVSAPTVQTEIPGGIAIITGSRNFDEANRLAQDLNTGAIPAPVHLVGQVTVEATLGKLALKQSLKAALLGFLLVGIYMIYYYRVLGAVAVVALLTYSIIFLSILKLPLLLFTDQYVVLTLAGIAGIILSIGMAVDANILIFERMKEELRKGKMLQTAADTGFKRAWTSIRDSNVSTLLTAAILFIIGTSIVRGFAVTLSIGILLSMFTAVVVTRFLIRLLYKSPVAENMAAFGVKRSPGSPPPL